MRTRFLPTDYSTTATADDCGSVEIPDFIRLPVPNLSPSTFLQFSANSSRSFDEIPLFGISHEIEKLSIDDALSIFLCDVLPHYVDGASFEEPTVGICEEKYEVIPTEEKGGKICIDKGGNGLKFLEFEIAEMDITVLPSECPVHSQVECSLTFSEISDAESKEFEIQDSLNSGLTLFNMSEMQQSVYSVNHMTIDYSMDQKSDFLEDSDMAQGKPQSHNIKFPFFEVDVEILGILGRIYKMDDLLSFENIEKQQVAHPDVISSNNKELLGSMEFDLIKYLLQNCVPLNCLEDTNSPSEFNCISMVELSCCQDYSTLRYGKQEGDLIRSHVLFDELLFFDLDPYGFCEVLSDSAKEIEAVSCKSLFGEAMNFKSFSDLIVCHELTPVDDYFKSLPVPILSDHGHLCSSHALVEELLAQLDWQSSSASDGLYLDWNFLGEDDSGSGKYSSCWKIVLEIDTYDVDASVDSIDSVKKQIFDFILSDCHSDKTNSENCKQILNLSESDVSMFHSDEACVSSLRNHVEGKKMNEDTLRGAGVRKVPNFSESMSSDLEFFLNPRNYVKGRESIPPDKSIYTNTACQVLMSTDNSVAASTTAKVQQKLNAKRQQEKDLDFPLAQTDDEAKLEELLNLNVEPVKEIHGDEPVKAVSEDKNCNRMPVQSMPVDLESKQNLSCKSFFPKRIIIVNTRNFNDEMVISRRNTYERILQMEKEGTQVVERDIGLPVDVIISSSVCLTWYDCKNIGRKASAPDEAFSCLPQCVESIAASILTSLSFAFSCSIMIFEGDSNFLCSIMESSDELYAAAASLGVDIQLFYSYSYEMTEEIILSSINIAAELNRDLYPRMTDSETLAESFLTAFPSINPLSAHAILSSDVPLGKFLELSNEGRIFALKRFKVPDESVALLSAISRYGEQEDAKSGLTNCSSSVSVPNSEYIEFKTASARKKPKYTQNMCDPHESPDLFHMESLKLLPDHQLNPPNLFEPGDSWFSRDTEIYNKSAHIGLSFNDKLLSNRPGDVDLMKKSVNKSSIHDFPLTEGLHILEEKEKPWMPQFDKDCSPRWKSAMTSNNSFSTKNTKATGNLQENFAGEVVDLEDNPAFTENFTAGSFANFSPFALDDYAARSSRMSKRPFSSTDLPLFTNPNDNDSAHGTWDSRDKAQFLRKEVESHFDTINRTSIPTGKQNMLVEGNTTEKVPQTPYNLFFQDKETRNFGGTPLSNARHSTHVQGSPWKIEFLNRIREMSKLRKQPVSQDSTPPCFGSSGNTSKFTKTRSPSILEFYKYEGGSKSQKKVQQTRLKRSSQPLDSLKNKNAPASCPPSRTPIWTPADKKARRALSFSTNGSGGQSKLVWRDNNYQTAERRL